MGPCGLCRCEGPADHRRCIHWLYNRRRLCGMLALQGASEGATQLKLMAAASDAAAPVADPTAASAPDARLGATRERKRVRFAAGAQLQN